MTLKKWIIGLCLLPVGFTLAGESSGPWNEWLSSQATPKTREVTTLGADGSTHSVVTTSEYNIHVKQTNVEEQTLGEDQQLHLSRQRRITEVIDAHGGRYTLREERSGLDDALVPRQIVEEIKTPGRTVTTVKTRNDDNRLLLTRRTTTEQRDDGSTLTKVETLDTEGNLTVTQRQIEW